MVSGPAHGALTLNANGSFLYTPTLNYNGSDSFTYKVNDGALDSNIATVNLSITAVNDAPVAVNDSFSTNEDTALNIPAAGVLANDSDIDTPAAGLSAVLVSGPAHGTLTLNANGSFLYTPTLNYNGSDSFTYKVNDGALDSNIATVNLSITAVNDAPVAVNDSYSTNEDTTLNIPAAGVLANDSDVDTAAASLSAVLVSGPAHGTLTLNANGSFLYTPTLNYNGSDSFTYKVNDGALDSNIATVNLSITAVNDAPAAVNDSYSTTEDTTLNIPTAGVLTNDTDVDTPAASLSAMLVSGPTHGALTLNADGSFSYTPTLSYNGSDSFTYKVNDGFLDSNIATVNLTITAVNDAPVAVNDSYSTNEDTALNIPATGILTNDTDVDTPAASLSAMLVSGPTHGALTLNADGSFSYTPILNYNGSDSFTYKVNDGSLDSNIATVNLTITAVNDAPVAVNDSYSTNEDTALNIPATGILTNDTDVDTPAASLSAMLVSGPTHGALTLNADGSFSYTPTLNYNGSDSFTYKVNDGFLDSNIATVNLTITAVNDAPAAINDSYSTNEDAILNIAAAGVLANDSDVDTPAAGLSAVLVSGPAHGTLSLNADGSFSYTPTLNYNGSDSFTYKVNDGSLDSNIATVNLSITAVNDAPVAVGDSYTTNEDIPLNVAAAGILANDSDIDTPLAGLSAVLVSGPTNGVLTLNADGSFSYTPNSNYNGSDSFTYKVNDGFLDSNIATVNLSITAVNDAPVAVGDSYTTNEDIPLNVAAAGVLANDSDIDTPLADLSAVLVSGPTNGVLSLNADGSFSYTPNSNYNGSDSFTYKVNDGALDSNIATVNLSITAVNDAPVAVNDSYSTNEDTALNIPAAGVLANDSDVDTPAAGLSAVLVSGPTHGTLSLNADGSFSYNPDLNYNGSDSFTYKVNDGFLDSNIATVNLSITAVDDAPIAVNDSYSTNEDTALNVPAAGVLVNDSDVDTPAASLSAVLVSGPTHGTLSLNADGSFSYNPDFNYNGSDSFTYKVNDGFLDSNIATVNLSITAVDDAPVAVNDSYSTNEDTTLNIPATGILTNDTDIDTPAASLSAMLVSGPAHGSLTLNADGSFLYTPTLNYNGSDSFTYKVNDGALDSNIATVNLSITAVNDAPVAVNDSYSTNEDTALNIPAAGVLANDSDVDTAAASLSAMLVSGPAHGALTLNTDGSFLYTPTLNYNGSDSFTYKVNDGSLDSNIATVNLSITAVNDAPVAVNDSYSTNEDTALNIPATGILTNDTDVDTPAASLSAMLVSGPTHGALTLNADGSFSYTPTLNYNGSDSFTYKVNDGFLDSNIATVNLTITAVNNAPVAVNDSYSTNEDAILNIAAAGVLANDSDVDTPAASLSAMLVSGPAHGTLTLNADGSFSYTPALNFNGSDSFTYKVNDGALDSNIATVNLSITAVNDAPVAVGGSYTTNEDIPLNVAAAGVLANDSDIDTPLAGLSAVLVSGPTNGVLSLNADGSFSYTPNSNYNGSDSFTYKVNDGALDSNIATVNLSITAVNDAPVAVNDSYSTNEDTALNIPAAGVLANDSDVDTPAAGLSAVLVSGPTHGTLSLNADGSFSYTPTLNYNGSDSFSYKVNDGALDSNIATVSLSITAVNDASVAVNDSYSTNEDTALNVPAAGVLVNDSDVDTPAASLSAVLVSGPTHGTLSLNADGSFSYNPDLNYNGSDSFSYKVNDGSLDSNIATVNLSITAVDDAPVAVNDSYSTNEDTAFNVPAAGVLVNDSDVDTPAASLSAVLVSGPTHGTLSLNADGSFSYNPDLNYNGSDSFTYKVNDGFLDSNIATVNLSITAVNDAPVAANDSYSTNEDTALNIPATGILTNDTDIDTAAASLSAMLVSGPAHGSLTLNADGSFSYTPALNFNGSDSFSYKVNDGALDSNIATVSLSITAVNDASVAVNDSYSTNEDTALNIPAAGVLANDSDVDTPAAGLSAVLVSGPTHGTLSLNADGSFSYNPDLNYNGSDSFTYKVNDGFLDSNIATVNLSITAVNDAPVAVNDSYSTNEDTALNIPAAGVLANDSDVDTAAASLSAVLVSGPAHGSLTLNVDGSFSYTPTPNYNGSDSFTYKVNDGSLDSNIATVNISIGAVNNAPVAANDSYSTNEDTALNIPAAGVLANDSDIDTPAASLSAVLVSGPTHGTLSLNADGSFSYTPTLNYNGSDSFTYKVNDGSLDSNIATVNLSITAVNDAPVAVNDSYSTNEDTALNIPAAGVLANDSDVDTPLAGLSAVLVSGPAHGALTLNVDGSFSYTPTLNYNGSDSFTYKVNDGFLDSNIATVNISIGAVNNAPVAANDSYSTNEDTALNIPTAGVLANDSDVDTAAANLSAMLVSGPAHGALTLNADGSFSYTPTLNYNGSDSFTYKVNDGFLDSNIATVNLSITAVNDAPVAVNDSYSTNEDTALNIPAAGVLANDSDVDTAAASLSAVLVSGPAHGSLTLNVDGSFSYTPTLNYNGSDSFTYKVNDGSLDSNIATVNLSITAVNDAPVAVNDSYSTNEDTALNIPAAGVLANDSDVDTAAASLSAMLVSGPAHGALTLNTDGSFLYTPTLNYNGSDSFTYKVNDGSLDSNIATVNLSVTAVNDAPVAVNDSYSTNEDTALNIPAAGVLTNDTDVDTPAASLSAMLVSGPAHGALTLNVDGSFSYTPTLNYNGSDSFTYKVNDGSLDSNIATVNLSITAVNDTPVAVNDSYSTNEDTALNIPAAGVLANDSDVDTPLAGLSAVLVSGPAHGALTLNVDGSFSYTPTLNYNGSDSFTYKVNDGFLDSNIATVNISIGAVNNAPVAANDSYSTNEDTALNIPAAGVLANDTDVDTPAASLSAMLVSGPAHGALTLNVDGSFSYTPTLNYNGSDSFTYKVNDGSLDSNIATVNLSITAVNDAPVAVNDSYSTNEDSTLTVPAAGVLANDTDVDTAATGLSAVLVSGPAHGALSLNADGSFSYAPTLNYNGSDSFTYKVNDGSFDSNIATVNLTITAVNDAPVAVNDSNSTNEDTALNVPAVGVLINDTDIDTPAASLSAVLVSGPAHGALTLNADGSFSYAPTLNYNGTDSFTYKVNDGSLDSNIATVNLTITAVNDAPVAANDSYSTNEDTALNIPAAGVLANDSDVETAAASLSAMLVSGPAHGSLTLNADGSFSYTPILNYNGSDSFTYKVNDGFLDSNIATVNLSITAVNDAPVAVNDSYSTNEDTTLNIPATGILTNDTDIDTPAASLSAMLVSGPAHGSLTLNADGSFSYTPALNYNGSDSFTYKVNDGSLDSNIATVNLTINSVNDAPIAVNDSYSINEDSTLTVPAAGVLANDTDVDTAAASLSAALISGPAHGSLTLNTNGSFSYTPTTNYNGPDSFTYKVNDGSLNSNIATVNLTVNSVNDAPVAINDSYSTNEDTTLTIPAAGVLANDTDIDTAAASLSAVLVSGPAHGSLSLNANGSFSFTPTANYNGADSFTYKVNDGSLNSNTATVSLNITPVNDAPSFNLPTTTVTVLEDAPAQTVVGFAQSISAGPADEVGQTLNFIVTNNNNSLFSVQPTIDLTGKLSYTLAANANGSATVQVQLMDSGGTANSGINISPTKSFTINATPVNDAPSFNLPTTTISTLEDSGPQNIAAFATGLSAGPANESSQLLDFILTNDNNALFSLQPTIDATGKLTYTLAPNRNGLANVTVKIHDNGGTANGGIDTSATKTFTINAAPVNDAPTFTVGANQTAAQGSGLHTVTGFITNGAPGGGPDEASQILNYIVTNNNNALFTVQPFISANGTLTYTLAASASGTASIQVVLMDNGGTANGGINTSTPQFFSLTVTPATTGRIYVDLTNNGTADGLTWTTAYRTLDAGLNKARSLAGLGVTTMEIWIADGTYTPAQLYAPGGVNGGAMHSTNTSLYTFDLVNGLTIFGGFEGKSRTGGGETSVAQRDLNNIFNTTILTGSFSYCGTDIWHVVTAGNDVTNTGITAALDGLTIVGGDASGPSGTGYDHGSGGGLRVIGNSTITLNNMNFLLNEANRDGGAIWQAAGTLTINNSNFLINDANRNGGAIFMQSGNLFINCTLFALNEATNGGAIYANNVQGSITNTVFYINDASTSGGALYVNNSTLSLNYDDFVGNTANCGYGGAIYSSGSTITANNSIWQCNWASANGGAVQNGGAVLSTFNVDNSDFVGNTSASGSGGHIANGGLTSTVTTDRSVLLATDSLFQDGWAKLDGGAIINLNDSTATLLNDLFVDNYAGRNGGAIASIGASNSNTAILIVKNSTFISDDAKAKGDAIYSKYTKLTTTNDTYINEGSNPVYKDTGTTVVP